LREFENRVLRRIDAFERERERGSSKKAKKLH
jgi:hypothetical protein